MDNLKYYNDSFAYDYDRFVSVPKKKAEILSRLAEAVHLKVNHDLPLDVEVTGIIHRNGYRIEKLAFQADCNRYVTACLYVPDGDGPFPAVLNVHGHWKQGHLAERVQKEGMFWHKTALLF